MSLDAPYQETDPVSPHFSHMIQPLSDGTWICLTCEPLPEEIDDGAITG